jgi:hypothetical protein
MNNPEVQRRGHMLAMTEKMPFVIAIPIHREKQSRY